MLNSDSVPILCIDGPSGAGKGTAAQLLARELGWHYLDSGAIYRVLAAAALKHGIALDDGDKLAALAAALDLIFEFDGESLQVMLEGEEVSHIIRTEDAGAAASQVAAIPAVRQALLARQRDFAQAPGLVADGRDMGTVVFKDSPFKVFLTASAESRAERRYKQLKEKGIACNISDLYRDIAARDKRDSERAVAPLRPADDALVLDTTDMSITQVFEKVLSRVNK